MLTELNLNEPLEQSVFRFLAAKLSVRPERLKSDMRLREDLGVDGLDGVEFLEAFSEAFRVRDIGLFEGIKIHHYFNAEAMWNPPGVSDVKIPITVRDLIESARAGEWRIAASSSAS